MQKLTTDITYLPFGPKRLYLSSIMDLRMEEIIAYTISSNRILSLYWILNQIDLPKDVLHIVIKAAFILLLNTTIYMKRRIHSIFVGLPYAPSASSFAKSAELFLHKDEVITSSSVSNSNCRKLHQIL